MKCLNCGSMNSPQALKCTHCNVPLDGSMVVDTQKKSNKPGQVTCKNCMSSNPADALKCSQCNAPLEGSMILDHSGGGITSPGQVVCKNCKSTNPADALRCHQCNAPLDGSMVIKTKEKEKKVSKVEMQTIAITQDKQPTTTQSCPSCGYPNQAHAIHCVQCGTDLQTSHKQAEPIVQIVQSDHSDHKPVEDKSHLMTINPWMDQPVTNAFELIPLNADLSAQSDVKKFEGNAVTLHRQDLDPTNNTITSSGQAKISHYNGQWQIEDLSSMQTTFIKVQGPTLLKEGDILLMGNKLFKFKTK